MKDFVARLTSEEGRAWVRRAAKLVLRVVGDEPGAPIDGAPATAAPSVADAAVIMSAVAKGASAAGRVASDLRGRASFPRITGRGGFGKIALGLGAGLAIGGAVYWLASPAGREKTRALWHRARGWRRPKANIGEAPREAAPSEA